MLICDIFNPIVPCFLAHPVSYCAVFFSIYFLSYHPNYLGPNRLLR